MKSCAEVPLKVKKAVFKSDNGITGVRYKLNPEVGSILLFQVFIIG